MCRTYIYFDSLKLASRLGTLANTFQLPTSPLCTSAAYLLDTSCTFAHFHSKMVFLHQSRNKSGTSLRNQTTVSPLGTSLYKSTCSGSTSDILHSLHTSFAFRSNKTRCRHMTNTNSLEDFCTRHTPTCRRPSTELILHMSYRSSTRP